jgi:hypothetical protein
MSTVEYRDGDGGEADARQLSVPPETGLGVVGAGLGGGGPLAGLLPPIDQMGCISAQLCQ